MKWSLRIGTLFDIPVYVHVTFWLLLAWVGLTRAFQAGDLGQGLAGVLFLTAIFLCVLLHELGHALAARRFGIRTRDVTLLPIGGVARLERMPDRPRQELWVALAGPAVNVVIAGMLALWLGLRAVLGGSQGPEGLLGSFAFQLLAVNLLLVAFNMLPAFPMDGGRVLRALLAERLEHDRATAIAARTGRGFAVLFAIGGLYLNPFLLLIALFVWFGAGQEAGLARVKASLEGTPIGSAMLTDFEVLAPRDPLRRAVEMTVAGSQRDFPVVDGGRMVGILRQADLLEGLSRLGARGAVEDAMMRDVQLIELTELVEPVAARLQSGAARTLPVTREGRLVGLATLENIREYIAIRQAMTRRRSIASAGTGAD